MQDSEAHCRQVKFSLELKYTILRLLLMHPSSVAKYHNEKLINDFQIPQKYSAKTGKYFGIRNAFRNNY